MTDQLHTWWKESSVYQIYPASFQDSTGSGLGDLKGIIARVDYLHKLGVDILWLSPIFKSPQVDMGYDISDYRSIHPPYGHISDVDILRDELHARGMKLVLDLVVNHTSDQHEWFRESRKSKDNPYRDWYIWRPPRYDADGNRQPPNNWDSHFQGSAWEYDETTDEYYLHLFCKEQPDLNWENPLVRKSVHEIMRFWLDRGADGFRMDVINFISKDQSFPDSKLTALKGPEFYACGPRLHEYLKELGSILREYNAFSVGEMPCVDDELEIIKAVRADRGELSMIFHFQLMVLDHGPQGKFSSRKWTLAELRKTVTKWQEFMYDNDGWNALYLENHDQPRSISRFLDDSPEHRVASAKLIAIFLLLQAGTPFIYQGQEIGMTNVPKSWPIDEYKDIDCLNHWELYGKNADEKTQKYLMKNYQAKSRDNARTPMQWDTSAHAGFTAGSSPWMRVNDNYKDVNAASQTPDADSVYHCYRHVLEKRKALKHIFVYGDYDVIDEQNEHVFAYKRISTEGHEAVVACNFSAETVHWTLGARAKEVVATSVGKTLSDLDGGKVRLGPYEALAVLIETRRREETPSKSW
ncbi:family 13 glycoside hydrolase [Stachybotrys elegans]|uniref:Family 13 glycoside hydrolase n=1 Tax=Stachybotrys elegans TaxID=80388 RepID=A0A8K0WVS9_9HYPO|nr:family 13 glycoside hydrolase [Stachybotrys elegans]